MSTHIDIDNDLLNEAVVLGHFRTKRAAVNAALAEFGRLGGVCAFQKTATDYQPVGQD
jgi:hypothetical protein